MLPHNSTLPVKKAQFFFYQKKRRRKDSLSVCFPNGLAQLSQTQTNRFKSYFQPSHTFGAIVTLQINTSTCGVWEANVGVQVFSRELHPHIYLD